MKVEDSKNHSNKTWQRKQYGTIQIPSNKLAQHWRKHTREIDRINHHMHKNELLTDSQYGFTPKRVQQMQPSRQKNHRTRTGKKEGGDND
jgi:hypothetical protein